ncbi:uncharacterized protein BO80DRAFT_427509 [Aspergillus ibericus CBS 121593]|uniref:Uncharacterized protein n=1 Tax=Aspergillus ibericus CBS 121593 TaxID=1448316 RepID=A0A395GVW5_9EURO|nr:hypothetical protein BO80DRAFT_427509 [Aspergillus ibericus CBS 121593]RAK98213.1 hypothetical protein BO80DRAFT_427509 [Aspergillus ibericus CBS 121593]
MFLYIASTGPWSDFESLLGQVFIHLFWPEAGMLALGMICAGITSVHVAASSR